ncbi:hypothetical protein HZH66_012364 [Vespula vulgaris]|uniref:Uncharacterized protein n=1 Tax=Vespula vulgaris TaxID=7454 RepID=A0A834J952_VESVU|nr:hypothetical protein HZH66_012364 [Vespula vulgaris]
MIGGRLEAGADQPRDLETYAASSRASSLYIVPNEPTLFEPVAFSISTAATLKRALMRRRRGESDRGKARDNWEETKRDDHRGKKGNSIVAWVASLRKLKG